MRKVSIRRLGQLDSIASCRVSALHSRWARRLHSQHVSSLHSVGTPTIIPIHQIILDSCKQVPALLP